MKKDAIMASAFGLASGVGLLLVAWAVLPNVGKGPRSAGARQTIEYRQPLQPDRREPQLLATLQSFREQIELYRLQHDQADPGFDRDGKFDKAAFIRQLTQRTNDEGKLLANAENSAGYFFGPYVTRIPANPYVQGAMGRQISFGPDDPPCDGSTGWFYNTNTRTLWPNDTAHRGFRD